MWAGRKARRRLTLIMHGFKACEVFWKKLVRCYGLGGRLDGHGQEWINIGDIGGIGKYTRH